MSSLNTEARFRLLITLGEIGFALALAFMGINYD
jgi:hypothetical protein